MKKEDKKKDIERFEALKDAAAQIADGNFDIKKYYGITDDGLEAIYNIGYEMYNHKKYENAGDVFSLLTVLEPSSTNIYRHVHLHNIWLGITLGHCCFLKCL